jgi:hypothetical protein
MSKSKPKKFSRVERIVVVVELVVLVGICATIATGGISAMKDRFSTQKSPAMPMIDQSRR